MLIIKPCSHKRILKGFCFYNWSFWSAAKSYTTVVILNIAILLWLIFYCHVRLPLIRDPRVCHGLFNVSSVSVPGFHLVKILKACLPDYKYVWPDECCMYPACSMKTQIAMAMYNDLPSVCNYDLLFQPCRIVRGANMTIPQHITYIHTGKPLI